MKKIYVMIAACAFACVSAKAQEFNTQGMGTQAHQPSVMVVPYINEELDNDADKLRAYIDSNPLMKIGLSKVKEAFDLKGFPTRDFVGALRVNRNRRLVSASKGTSSSVAKSIIRNSKAEIIVYLTPIVTRNNDLSEVRFTLDAQEAMIGQSFANTDLSSGSYRTNDTIMLADRALETLNTTFFYQIEDGFNQMVEEGRDVSILVEFAEGCEVGPYTRLGAERKTLSRALLDWGRSHAYHQSCGDPQSADGIIEMTMKVPVYLDDTGEPYQISLTTDALLTFFDQLLGEQAIAEVAMAQGQNIHFVITNP